MTFHLNPAALEAVAQADAALNNACVPTYSEVVATLVYLTQQAKLSDLHTANNDALLKSRLLLERFHAVQARRAAPASPRLDGANSCHFTPDTSEQQFRIGHVMDRTGCTAAQARAELEAEEWSTQEATCRLRQWMAEQATSALARFRAPVNDEASPYDGRV